MATASISRGGTSVTFTLGPLDGGANPVVASDIGKPESQVREAGDKVRTSDTFSAIQSLSVTGRLTGSSAYDDAKTLAEDLIKPYSDGVALELDLTALPRHASKYEVAPSGEGALSLEYPTGGRDMVGIDLSLIRVDNTLG